MAKDMQMLREAHRQAWARRQHFCGYSPQEEFLGAIVVNRHQREGAVNCTRVGDKCPTHHAEIRAMGKIGDPKGATVYVARTDARGQWANAKPCPGCEAAMRKAGVKRVWYTESDNVARSISL